jgi:glucan-binding YG repeat protein
MSETLWQQDTALGDGQPYYFRHMEGGKMLLAAKDAQRGAWYWLATAGPLPKGTAYVSGPDYANPEAAKGAADYYAATTS